MAEVLEGFYLVVMQGGLMVVDWVEVVGVVG